ncbi:hypothetical protein HanHA89_Chr00c12g0745571 [Helianthus annuus]|nr:hypothetical protein HanHA89_Chr00c12g0745571 [Helianthus annuus]
MSGLYSLSRLWVYCVAYLRHGIVPIEHCLVPRIRNLMWAWVLRDPCSALV